MITMKDNTTLVAVSELRNQPEKIFNEMRTRLVMIEKHRKPVAVLISIERYEEMEKLLELAEDYALGMLAKERDQKTKSPQWVSMENAMKRVGLKHF